MNYYSPHSNDDILKMGNILCIYYYIYSYIHRVIHKKTNANIHVNINIIMILVDCRERTFPSVGVFYINSTRPEIIIHNMI